MDADRWGSNEQVGEGPNRHRVATEQKGCGRDNSLVLAKSMIKEGDGSVGKRGGLKRWVVDQLIEKRYFCNDPLVSFLSSVSHAERSVLSCTFISYMGFEYICRLHHKWCRSALELYEILGCGTQTSCEGSSIRELHQRLLNEAFRVRYIRKG